MTKKEKEDLIDSISEMYYIAQNGITINSSDIRLLESKNKTLEYQSKNLLTIREILKQIEVKE